MNDRQVHEKAIDWVRGEPSSRDGRCLAAALARWGWRLAQGSRRLPGVSGPDGAVGANAAEAMGLGTAA